MKPHNYTDTRLLIDNEWLDAASRRTIDVINPATGKTIGRVAHAGIDLEEAAHAKLAKNAAKYPVEKSYGSSRKYSQLEE